MATKPTSVPRWANVKAGAIVEPPETSANPLVTTKDTGVLPNTRTPAQYANWVWHLQYLWILWLQDINNQAFTAAGVGAWTKTHEFSPTVANTGGAIFTGNGTGLGLASYGGGSNGTGIYCEGRGDGNGINAIANGAGPAGAFENGASGPGLTAQGGPDTAADGGTFYGGVGGAGGRGITSTGAGSGVGIAAFGGAGNGIGGYFTGGGNGNGVVGEASGTGIGVKGVGGSTSGAGVQGRGTASGAVGGDFIGAGTGQGITAVGGSSSGVGATITGGGSTGHGIIATGGSTNGSGIIATGVGASGRGGDFSANAASLAIVCGTGNMAFTGAQPVKTADPGFNNYLCGTNVSKAWATLSVSGGAVTLDDGYNVVTVTVTSAYVEIDFARAFANVSYSATVSTNFNSVPTILVQSVSKMRIQFVSTPAGSPNADLVMTSVVNMKIFIHVYGRQ